MFYDLIAAVDEYGGIGFQGQLPWKSADYFFTKKTLGKKLLVGKNTKIPSFLFDKNKSHREIIVADHTPQNVNFVIGGAKLYGSYINNCRRIYITRVIGKYEADTFFPAIPEHFVLKKKKLIFPDKSIFSHVEVYENISVDFPYLKLARKILKLGPQTAQIGFVISKSLIDGKLSMTNKSVYLLPIITSKKIYIKAVLEELLFFLRGDTDTKKLEEKNINIWKANTSLAYLKSRNLDYAEGEAGPIYGAQWIKQFPYVFNELIKNPNSRRAIFTAWIPSELEKMCLPPCHITYQLLIRDNKLHISMYQRSADTFLGLPFNLASCGFMCIIFAKYLNLEPGSVTISIGDAHIYKEHTEAIQTQMLQDTHAPAQVSADLTFSHQSQECEKNSPFANIKATDFEIKYVSSDRIFAPLIV